MLTFCSGSILFKEGISHSFFSLQQLWSLAGQKLLPFGGNWGPNLGLLTPAQLFPLPHAIGNVLLSFSLA